MRYRRSINSIKVFNVCQILLMSKFWPVLDHSSHVLFSKYIFCVSNQSSCSAISKKYALKNKSLVLNEIQRFLLGLSRLYIQAQIYFWKWSSKWRGQYHPQSLSELFMQHIKLNLRISYFLWSRYNIIFKIFADIRYVLGTANTFRTHL